MFNIENDGLTKVCVNWKHNEILKYKPYYILILHNMQLRGI